MRSTLTPFILSLVFLIAPIATAQTPLGTVFTYQGELTSGGVPLAAIQGLHEMVKEQQERIASLEKKLAELAAKEEK